MFTWFLNLFRRKPKPKLRKPPSGPANEIVWVILARNADRPDLPPNYPAAVRSVIPPTDGRAWIKMKRSKYDELRAREKGWYL